MTISESVLWIVLALCVALGAAALWALPSGGVAVIETRTLDGTARSTRVWYTEPDGELWLEAGTPENPWFLDVQQQPLLTFRADGRTARYVARIVADPAGHSRIRASIRGKYGLRDRWIGLVVDTSRSVAVRLTSDVADPGAAPVLPDVAPRSRADP